LICRFDWEIGGFGDWVAGRGKGLGTGCVNEEIAKSITQSTTHQINK
jgi:hypothetical protein